MEEAERLCDRVAIVDHGKVIALGTPRELVASLSAEHVVEFAAGNGTQVDEASLRRVDGVAAAIHSNGSYRVRVAVLHLAVPALLAELHRQGISSPSCGRTRPPWRMSSSSSPGGVSVTSESTTRGRGWRHHPLAQLTLVRYREFFREPEAVFWVFVFPVLLTAGLGIAFRNQAPERTPVAVVQGARASALLVEALGRSRTSRPPRSPQRPRPRRSGRAAWRW